MQSLALSVDFGSMKANATGSSGVGYALVSHDGTVVSPRTTAGVTQVTSGSGIYRTFATLPEGFQGHVEWDTGTTFARTYRAVEDLNLSVTTDAIYDIVQSMNGSLAFVRGMTAGRWKVIDNQMLFYAEDNVTLIAKYDLLDGNGLPSSGPVFERVKVT